MKKYTISIILIILIIPSIAFAAWWNPLSWLFWIKERVRPSQLVIIQPTTIIPAQINISKSETQKITKEKIVNLQNQIKELQNRKSSSSAKIITKPKTTTTVKNETTTQVRSVTTPVAFDACKNIDGIQQLAPDGMYADNGICSPIISMKDTYGMTSTDWDNLKDKELHPLLVFKSTNHERITDIGNQIKLISDSDLSVLQNMRIEKDDTITQTGQNILNLGSQINVILIEEKEYREKIQTPVSKAVEALLSHDKTTLDSQFQIISSLVKKINNLYSESRPLLTQYIYKFKTYVSYVTSLLIPVPNIQLPQTTYCTVQGTGINSNYNITCNQY